MYTLIYIFCVARKKWELLEVELMRSFSGWFFSTNYDLFNRSCLSSKFFEAISHSHILTDFPGDVFKNTNYNPALEQKLYSFGFFLGQKKNIRYSLFPPGSAFSLKCLRTLVHTFGEMFKWFCWCIVLSQIRERRDVTRSQSQNS